MFLVDTPAYWHATRAYVVHHYGGYGGKASPETKAAAKNAPFSY